MIMSVYKNKETKKYLIHKSTYYTVDDVRIEWDIKDTYNIHDAYKFKPFIILVTKEYIRLNFDEELKNIRKEKLKELNGK